MEKMYNTVLYLKIEIKANMRKNSCVSLLNINRVDKSKGKIIFNGIVQNIRTSNINGNYYLEIQASTYIKF
ncbi:hypothetical protein [Clostridium estertheticum]|uniref:hypothetical protein n=1 Tax=Clostridium estertheticum TaxID=238834 RepID=UPI001CF1B07D|nr:hypothetical protein [Clostridium estertheticum]MCB2343393.1 hypothetical protein [Clostridium estertheticum]